METSLIEDVEKERLSFIEKRDGVEAAIFFAKQTIGIYRRSLLQSRKRGFTKPHYASIPEYREKFIKSYLSFKCYLAKQTLPKPEVTWVVTH